MVTHKRIRWGGEGIQHSSRTEAYFSRAVFSPRAMDFTEGNRNSIQLEINDY